ncbi:betaine--homocysteine S-methyltransferase 1-like [Mya arenaria]|nr:betaine--homocysteine S-methyltransferase 1-like [Mya arenaria]
MSTENALLKRLKNGGNLVVAEGYIFEFERKGYLQAGTFVPEVTIEHPELVMQMYEEFVHAGSDVVLAFTYYAHREKLRLIGRENELEAMNRAALQMARQVADKHGCLMAGNISNTTAYIPDDPESHAKVEQIFKEQVVIAAEGGADYIVGETFSHFGEASIALQAILKYGKGLPAVITLSPPATDTMIDGVTLADACKRLEDAGAAVVGLNCGRGPETMLPAIREIMKVCKGPVAALPVTYRTTPQEPTFFSLTIPGTKSRAFPLELCTCLCGRCHIEEFANQCREMGVQYVGLCCGNSANMTRIVAQGYGRTPPAARYAPAMEKHFIFGDKTKFKDTYTEGVRAHVGGDFD